MSQVIWITGLSGAGKSTLASAVVSKYRALNKPVVMLDGDDLRSILGAEDSNKKNHGTEGRSLLAMKYSFLCKLIANQGLTVVIATISMFKEIHSWNRENLPGYFEVYLKVPLEELRLRDPKRIYQRFDRGELNNVAGLDLKVDEPQHPDWVIDFVPEQSIETLSEELINRLQKQKK